MDGCKRVKVKITNMAIGACKGYWVVYAGKVFEIVKVLDARYGQCQVWH